MLQRRIFLPSSLTCNEDSAAYLQPSPRAGLCESGPGSQTPALLSCSIGSFHNLRRTIALTHVLCVSYDLGKNVSIGWT